MARILIIDDEEMVCDLFSRAVTKAGQDAKCAYTLQEGFKLCSSGSFDVVLLDMKLPDGNGLEKLGEIRAVASSPEVIILTGAGTPDCAELAIKSGAWDYIQKPASISDMILSLKRALQYREEKARRKPKSVLKLDGIIGSSAGMEACYDLLSEASSMDTNVLITGNSGTGKELFAKAIHTNSRQSGRNFVVVDCAALQETLMESTLFGYQKGAFTGAHQDHQGLIKQADGGTLFLDEIGELPLAMQKSFLRVLQERRFRPLGSSQELTSNFRVVAATNRDLDRMVEAGQFREDLLFRLRALTIELPNLSEHPGDISEIAVYHIAHICTRNSVAAKKLSPDFLEALVAYPWPGNIRELVNAMERAISSGFSETTLFRKHLPDSIRVKLAREGAGGRQNIATDVHHSLHQRWPKLKDLRESTYAKIEKQYLQGLMNEMVGNIAQACRLSGISRARLYYLLKKHGILTQAA